MSGSATSLARTCEERNNDYVTRLDLVQDPSSAFAIPGNRLFFKGERQKVNWGGKGEDGPRVAAGAETRSLEAGSADMS